VKALILSLAVLGAVTFSTPARADVVVIEGERGELDPNLLVIDPGDLFNGVISVEYERALSRHFGITVGASVWAFHGPFSFYDSSGYYTAFMPELGARFHFIREAPGGLWIGPTVSAGYVAANSTGQVSRNIAWGLGAAAGYNFVIGRHFTFQLGVGGRFTDYGDRLVWSPRLILGLGAVF
jgi:hypothetical protein